MRICNSLDLGEKSHEQTRPTARDPHGLPQTPAGEQALGQAGQSERLSAVEDKEEDQQ